MDMECDSMVHASDSSSDITLTQPMGDSVDNQEARLNNATWLSHPLFNPLFNLYWQAAASQPLIPQSAASLAPIWVDMGNDNSRQHETATVSPSSSPASVMSSPQVAVGGEMYDLTKLWEHIYDLKYQLDKANEINSELQSQLLDAEEEIESKDEQIKKLIMDKDKLKSVIHQKYCGGKNDVLSMMREQNQLEQASPEPLNRKKLGVSGECSDYSLPATEIPYHKKSCGTIDLIKTALKENECLRLMDNNQLHDVINSMSESWYDDGEYIIRMGDSANSIYVLGFEGKLAVSREGIDTVYLEGGTLFGELAILYNCSRTASVRAVSRAQVWSLDRLVFQAIMKQTGEERKERHQHFLRSVPIFSSLDQATLSRIADVLEVKSFKCGEFIVREDETGDTFYIIEDGEVEITQIVVGKDTPQHIRYLHQGDFFGEKVLLTEERRTASVMATKSGVVVLELGREAFMSHVGELSEFDADYGDLARGAECAGSPSTDSASSSSSSSGSSSGCYSVKKFSLKPEFRDVDLIDLEVISTLGVGGFGRVELVRKKYDMSRSYALKCMKKQHIVDTKQMAHVYNEKNILFACSNPFIIKLHKTFRDNKFVYMLMEVCLGGELWTVLRNRGHFDDHTARFCVACVLEAFQYLHSRGIVYRDLKPENLLVANSGYIKLVDFGFAKHIGQAKKTWTFCGTPEYVAPEVILNKGQDCAVDVWAIGILTYELTNGAPPFVAPDAMKIYYSILRGIDDVTFSPRVSRSARSLIKSVCRESPVDRLGYKKAGLLDIKKHKWFQRFDWKGLRRMTIPSPFLPNVSGPHDTSNFDRYSGAVELPPDEFSGWDIDF